MIIRWNKSYIGYSHGKSGKPCQDYSDSVEINGKTIITTCDGHGGDVYLRSDRGSRFASEAIIKAFSNCAVNDALQNDPKSFFKSCKLAILCDWNESVENDLIADPLTADEYAALPKDKQLSLLDSPVRAYGTTLIGACLAENDKLLLVKLGDGGLFLIKDGELEDPFPEEDDQVANLTYSMCQDDAFEHLQMQAVDFSECDGVLICTDGVVNPYQNLPNFEKSFALPVLEKISNGKEQEVNDYIELLGSKIGFGDDVSAAIICKSGFVIKDQVEEHEKSSETEEEPEKVPENAEEPEKANEKASENDNKPEKEPERASETEKEPEKSSKDDKKTEQPRERVPSGVAKVDDKKPESVLCSKIKHIKCFIFGFKTEDKEK